MKQKTSELEGAALDWAVALIEYHEWKEQGYLEVFPHDLSFDDGTTYAPSTDWAQGGPIIEREMIALEPMTHDEQGDGWLATRGEGSNIYMEFGPAALIVAMRCYVASKLGDEVTIPEEVR